MRLTILGCNGPFPEAGDACSGYLVESDSGKTKIVLDLGSGTLSKLLQKISGIDEIDAVILSHLHFDHMSDMPVLGYMLDFSGVETLKVICPETPAENRKLIKGKFDVYPPADTGIGEFKIEFVKVKHPVEAYAVKLMCDDSTLVYTGDTNECPEISLFCEGADVILADCGLSDEDWKPSKPHLGPTKCATLARESKAGELILTHLSPLYDKEKLADEARRIFANSTLAEAGMEFRI
ncbi:MAG: MBL fold metallo-hydrolase [Clostridia bacterium]|nr:MBL fold metallo-hydrolase [Clostridia bacterium]